MNFFKINISSKVAGMIRKYLLPFIFGVIAAFIVWGAAGALIRQLPLDDALKGLLIIGSALASFLLVNSYAAAKLAKNQ